MAYPSGRDRARKLFAADVVAFSIIGMVAIVIIQNVEGARHGDEAEKRTDVLRVRSEMAGREAGNLRGVHRGSVDATGDAAEAGTYAHRP